MKIYLDNIIFSLQKSGGISVVWKELLERMLKSNDLNCILIEYDNAKNNFFRSQIKITRKSIKSKYSTLLLIRRYLDVHLNNKNKVIFHSSYYRISSSKNVINVTTVHDFTYEYFFRGLSRKIHSWQKKRAIIKSDGIICISESTKKDLIHFIPEIDETKIRVIYNGVDKRYKKINVSTPFQKAHQFKDFEYAIYIGDRKAQYKNFKMAVESCKIQKTKLLIIGGGELTSEELEYLSNRISPHSFKSLNRVSVEDLNQYYNRAYCLLYPSYYEGFGIPIVEAQNAGCPVIATYSSSIPEVIADTSLAIYQPTPNKISLKMELIKPGSIYRENIIQLGLEKGSMFSWEKTYLETIDFYKKLIAKDI